jgi:hypothetical protein
MDRTLVKALAVISMSLGLALVFNFLFFGKLIGISLVILVVVLLAAVFLFGLRQQLSLRKSWWLILLIIFFALMLGIRANEFLSFLNVLATFSLLMLLAHQLAGTPPMLMKLRDYFILAILVPLRMLARAFSTISLLGQVHSKVKRRDVWVRIFKGAIMAVPILIVFGVLFSQADLAFSQFVQSFVHITISQRTMQYLALLAFAFVGALCFLSYIFFPKPVQPAALAEQPAAAGQSGRGIEVLVFLGLIAVLFAVFIGFQVNYLFGGESNIVNAGFTYAEYARRGFWELLAVAFLSLVVLLAAEKHAGVEAKKDRRFLVPALILIAEVVVIIVSAFKRLTLYIDTYGMTDLRFYVAGFIILLLVLFVLLAVKFILAKQEQFFFFGALLSVAGFLVAVNLVNPHAFIVRSNIEQYNRTGKVDVDYVAGLSADAMAGKLEVYNKLSGEDKEILKDRLQLQKEYLQENSSHWQSANLSRSNALKLLQGFGE